MAKAAAKKAAAKTPDAEVVFRLTVTDPVKGVALCLQGKDGVNVDLRMPTGHDLVFEVPARLGEGKGGWRFLGDHVRVEGKTRRFFYVAIGQGAGQKNTHWSRRAKIDFPDVTPAIVKAAAKGGLVMDATMAGADKKGEPACATIKLISPWKPAT